MSKPLSSIPAYIQLAEQLKARIGRGEFKPGARMPTEQDLVSGTGWSRVTVRSALRVLARDGWVMPKQGIGTFAAHPIEHELSSLKTIPEVLLMLGMVPKVRVLSFGTVSPPAEVKRALKLRNGKKVLRMKRLYSSGRTPIALVYVYLPLELREHAKHLKDERAPAETTFSILETKIGVEIKEAHHVVKAHNASAEVGRALRTKTGAPILVVNRLTVASDGRPLEYDICHYHSERYTFSVTVPRRRLSTTAKIIEVASYNRRLRRVRSPTD
jgi:GntR family transcriptional regulator